MTYNAAGVGFTAVDLIPPRFELSIRERVPGAKVDIDDYEKVGYVLAVHIDDEDWDSYDTEFKQCTLAGVVYIGAITGYFGIVSSRSWYGPGSTKAPIAHEVSKELVKHAIEETGYEKSIRTLAWPDFSAEDEMFNVAATMVRTRPFNVHGLTSEELASRVSGHVSLWGKQFAEETVSSLPHVFGYTARRPVGMMCVSAGFRFWAVGGASKFSSKKNRIAEDKPNIKEGFKKVLENISEYRCWKEVWWKGEWIET